MKEPEAVYGFRPFPARGGIVTHELSVLAIAAAPSHYGNSNL